MILSLYLKMEIRWRFEHHLRTKEGRREGEGTHGDSSRVDVTEVGTDHRDVRVHGWVPSPRLGVDREVLDRPDASAPPSLAEDVAQEGEVRVAEKVLVVQPREDTEPEAVTPVDDEHLGVQGQVREPVALPYPTVRVEVHPLPVQLDDQDRVLYDHLKHHRLLPHHLHQCLPVVHPPQLYRGH